MPYSDVFRDHIAHPRNAGELLDATVIAEETNPVCGDRLRLSLRIHDGRIEAARFLAYGCPPTLACGSALAEMIEGMTVQEAHGLTRETIVKTVGGLPTRKHHAAALAIETLRSALATPDRPERRASTDIH
jgi:nitrogen fixation protein NifU and related proteins